MCDPQILQVFIGQMQWLFSESQQVVADGSTLPVGLGFISLVSGVCVSQLLGEGETRLLVICGTGTVKQFNDKACVNALLAVVAGV